jgi:putative transcriptional regulator
LIGPGAALHFGRVREHGSSSLGLAGSLLIAHPGLLDPNFRRTVLFLGAHDEDSGAYGLVLNRPTGKTASEFLPNQELGGLSKVPVFVGGPVAPNHLTFVSFQWRPSDETVELISHVTVEDAWKMGGEGLQSLRAFVGYSGWAGGQLESELESKSWLVQRPGPEMLDLDQCRGLWQRIMREQSPWFRLLAGEPEDPSVN